MLLVGNIKTEGMFKAYYSLYCFSFYLVVFHFQEIGPRISVAKNIPVMAFSFSGLVASYHFLTVCEMPRESDVFS